MLNEASIATLEGPRRRARDCSRRRRDVGTALTAASVPRDFGERLLAQTLDSLGSFAGSALGIGFTVDDRGLIGVAMMHCSPGHDRGHAAELVRRLRQLEPIDPFNPRRAMACRASVMSAADVGGVKPYTRSMHGEHLRRLGYGPPVVLYLWRGDRIVAGVTLLREWGSPPFDAATVRLLRKLQPLLEHALGFAAAPPAQTSGAGAGAAGLTVREAEIASLVSAGATNGDIAATLSVTEATVKAHLTRVYAKIGVRSRTQLAVVMSGPVPIS